MSLNIHSLLHCYIQSYDCGYCNKHPGTKTVSVFDVFSLLSSLVKVKKKYIYFPTIHGRGNHTELMGFLKIGTDNLQ